MPAPATYDPSMVKVLVGGAIIGGFADGTFVMSEYTSDFFIKTTGADKLTTRVKQNDFSGTITLTLQQSSPSNDILAGFVALDRASNAGVVPVAITDLSGRTVIASAYGWVRKPPAVELSKEVSNREWIIDCAEMESFEGGNTQFSI